jgi:hypothetical protein
MTRGGQIRSMRVMNVTAASQSAQPGPDNAEAPVSPCELSAKSLMVIVDAPAIGEEK